MIWWVLDEHVPRDRCFGVGCPAPFPWSSTPPVILLPRVRFRLYRGHVFYGGIDGAVHRRWTVEVTRAKRGWAERRAGKVPGLGFVRMNNLNVCCYETAR